MAAVQPHRCSAGQDALHGSPVKVDQQVLREPGLFQLPEEKQSLLGLFDTLRSVRAPWQLPPLADSKELEVVDTYTLSCMWREKWS